jgi:hypothetical protein
LLCAAALAALAAFSAWHLRRTGFWYDESMQFWMSLGLDGFGAPHTPAGSFRDAIRHNGIANLDPGGFTVVMWLWLKLATGEVWQRILPLLFFLFGMGCFGWLGWTLRRSVLFAILSSLVPAAYPLLLDYATEVRAYSMEFAGIAVGCILLERARSRPELRPAFIAGAVFALFLGSRYSYGLFAAAAFFALSVVTLTDASVGRRQAMARLGALAAPIAVAAAVIFVEAFLPHYKLRIAPGDGAFLRYFSSATAAGKSSDDLLATLACNLLCPSGLALTLAALLGAAGLAPRPLREKVRADRLAPDDAMFGVLALAALVLSALFWRWHPWDMAQKWSLWLHALSAVSVVRLAAGALAWAPAPRLSGAESDARVAAVMVAAVLVLDMRLATHRRGGNTLVPVLAYLESAAPAAGSVAVDVHWYPTARYFYEYGAFAGSPLYPSAFRFPNWTGPKPLVSSQTRYLVTPRTLEEARARFKEHKITRDPAFPDQLFRVEPMAAQARSDG